MLNEELTVLGGEEEGYYKFWKVVKTARLEIWSCPARWQDKFAGKWQYECGKMMILNHFVANFHFPATLRERNGADSTEHESSSSAS